MTDPSSVPVICVDGPGGAGKGTLSLRLAEALGFHFLDSGAIYRLCAFAASRAGIATDDIDALAHIGRQLTPRFVRDPLSGGLSIWLDDDDVTAAVRSEICGMDASRIAVHPPVRQALLDAQIGMRRAPGLVADGRDMGTVVFPQATLKIFLTADAQIRAERRHKQLIAKGVDASLDEVLREVRLRDARDKGRANAPLLAADDAIVIDSSELSPDEVLSQALHLAHKRLEL